MKLNFYIISTMIIFNFCHASNPKFAMTNLVEPWRRLGDNITTVSKMLYFEYTYKEHSFAVYFNEFPYFDQFAISQNASMFYPAIEKDFPKKVLINKHTDIEKYLSSSESVLFVCHFLSETPPLYTLKCELPDFEALIKKAFRPLVDIPTLPKPSAVTTVALHVRKGGGFDKPLGSKQQYAPDHTLPTGFYLKKNSPEGSHMDAWHINWPASPMFIEAVKHYIFKKANYSDYIWPIKFPCDQYYIDCLKELAAIMPGKNLLVYLFTDDPEPEKIMERYSAQLKEFPRIIFSYRATDNHHTKNVIEDLFSLTQCDCMISASSSFAHAAQLLGEHEILMFPVSAITFADRILINKVGILTNNKTKNHCNNKLEYREITYSI